VHSNNDALEKKRIIVGANDYQDNLSAIKGFYLLTEINKMERDSFVFYRSFYNCLKGLPLEDRDILSMAIYEYALD
jgi:hypothetical protein